MALSCFDDKTLPPTEADVAAALGACAPLWHQLVSEAQQAHGPLEPEWAHPGKAYGWSFRLRQKRRVLVYLTPQQGFFYVGVVLGERACQMALADEALPAELRQALAEARPYAEGRGIRRDIHRADELPAILRLLRHKTA